MILKFFHGEVTYLRPISRFQEQGGIKYDERAEV